MNYIKISVFAVACILLSSCKKDQTLVSCSSKDGTSLKIKYTKNHYVISGQVNYKESPTSEIRKKDIKHTIPKESNFFYNTDPFHLESRNKKDCLTFGFQLVNDSDGNLKKCYSNKSQTEWVGKYKSSKAGPKTKEKDDRARKILKNIESFCSPYYKKIVRVTYWNAVKPNKHCSTDGIELHEMRKQPIVWSGFNPIQGVYSKECQFNQKMIDSLKE